MARKKRRKAQPPLPILLTELALASAETIARRGMLMAQGRCSSREQRRMIEEKSRAALASLGLDGAFGSRSGRSLGSVALGCHGERETAQESQAVALNG